MPRSGLENFIDQDPICPERLDQDPVNIRPDPKPWLKDYDERENRLSYMARSLLVDNLSWKIMMSDARVKPSQPFISVKLFRSTAQLKYVFVKKIIYKLGRRPILLNQAKL